VVCIFALVFRGLHFGVEFTGGSVFQFQAPNASVSEVRSATLDAGAGGAIVQEVAESQWRVQTEHLGPKEVTKVQETLADRFGLPPNAVSPQVIGPSWGQDISAKALQGLGIFLVLVVAYLSITFEWKMALAAVVALLHDVVITVGVYSLVGFEVTPASVIGLLTILGYSLYDTVVVFDKVRENTAGLTRASRLTYSEAANLGVNQVLVRSINTSVIALLPVGAILFVGAGLLGAGTLKDLALALFVGIAAGTYSSIFIATPLLADVKEREPQMRQLASRVEARRKSRSKAASARPAGTEAGSAAETDIADDAAADVETGEEPAEAGIGSRRVVQQGPRRQPRRGSKRRAGGKKRR
jgi:preprotein translocase subunit SecF